MGTSVWNLKHSNNFKSLYLAQSNLNLLEVKFGSDQGSRHLSIHWFKIKRAL